MDEVEQEDGILRDHTIDSTSEPGPTVNSSALDGGPISSTDDPLPDSASTDVDPPCNDPQPSSSTPDAVTASSSSSRKRLRCRFGSACYR